MAPTHETFDFEKLRFAPALKPNKAGGKYANVAYGGDQVHFQLGASARETLRCPFGLDASPEDPGKHYIKLELTDATRAFVEKLDAALLAAAQAHSTEWFHKKHAPPVLMSMATSLLKPQRDESMPDCVKLKVELTGARATQIQVATWVGDRLSAPTPGTVEDLKGAHVLPVVRIQGGVWFMNGGKSFGMSLAAATLVVIKRGDEPGASSVAAPDFGDVEMVDASD